MNLDKYRSALEGKEILRILQKSSTSMDNFLWQSQGAGKTIVPIQQVEIDFVAREVVVTFDSSLYSLDKNSPLYVKLEYRSSVFKVPSFREGRRQVQFQLPKEIKTLELRAYPRHLFRPEEERLISFRPSVPGNRDSGSELTFRVLDVSQYGLGILVSEQNRFFLKNNRILWMTHLGDHKLEYPILAEVTYFTSEGGYKSHLKSHKELKVGLRLSGMIPTPVFDQFTK
jgi:hypothetical protein